jgi:heme A synthase
MNRFAKFAWGVVGWSVLNILWGAFVRASGSGAGCGNHWPNCNGEILPTPQNINTVIEFTHRALSGVLLLSVLALLIWGWRKYPKGNPIRIGVTGSAVFVLSEALLGAGLVLFHLVDSDSSVLRAVVIALHLLNTFILLAFLTLTGWWATTSGGKALSFQKKGYLPLLLGIGLLGVIMVGMSGAITALGDTLFPAKSLAEGFALDNEANAHFLIRLRVYHPIIAIIVGVYTLSLVNYIYSKFNSQATQRLSRVLGGLVLVQFAVGSLNLFLLAPIVTQIIHLLIADMLWISYILLSASSLSEEVA